MKKAIIILCVLAAAAPLALAERWPMGPGNVPQRCGNNCYEFQNYGSNSYYHDGLDVMGSGGDPVYSVADGYVRLISVSEPYYTGIIINYTNGQDKGWCYWHITASTIPFIVGDPVYVNDRIGNIATWPTSNFHHCHFTRSYYPGILSWYDAVDNPIEFMEPTTDTQVPVFEEAEAGQWFSFCENDTANRVDPGSVQGQVDIIAHISDKIVDTYWEVVPYKIDWWIDGTGGSIPETTFLVFTKDCPPASTVTSVVYKRDGQWFTQGDYNAREYYFIVSNTDGDGKVEDEDAAYAFDSTTLPDGPYTLYVRATDWAGNEVTQSMDFTIDNSETDVRVNSFAARALPREVELTWDAQERGGVIYNLYRREVKRSDGSAAAKGDRVNAEPIAGKSPYSFRDRDVEAGATYAYTLEAVDLAGKPTFAGPAVVRAGAVQPQAFALFPAAPNPARDHATFSFALPHATPVKLDVYDLAGRKVATVVDGTLGAGVYHYPLQSRLEPGVYLYRLTADEFAATKRMVVVK